MSKTPEETLDWLCWMWAQDGERFYPPEETAWECVEQRIDEYSDEYTDEALMMRVVEDYYWEEGQHTRALMEAVFKFKDLQAYGFDPVERAAREHRDLMERADGDVEPLDWSWWRDE